MAVTCVGIAVQDLVFRVDSLPREPGKYRASGRQEVGGGVAANAAVTVAALGADASLITCLGDDLTGDRILAGLQTSGVDVRAARRIAEAASPLSLVLVDAGGERLVVNHASDDLFERATAVMPDELVGADAVLTDMRWPNGAVPALSWAREAGIPAIVDCDHDPLVNRGHEILEAATHVIFSLATLLTLTRATEPGEALRRCADYTDAWVAATDGPAGVFWLDDDTVHHGPAFVVDVVDTLGAGDVFHGAFAVAVTQDASCAEALRFASAAAALKCTRPGGRDGVPNRAEVEALLARDEPWERST